MFKFLDNRIGDDSACLATQGHCQEDNLSCSGSYHSGLCAGHATRRCCVPHGKFLYKCET